MLAQRRVKEEVQSFYISSPFNNSICMANLTSGLVSITYKICTLAPNKCHQPSYMAHTDQGNLIATVDYGIIQLNLESGYVELLTQTDRLQKGKVPLDGPFGTAQVGQLGPLTKVPGKGSDVYVFADMILENLRVMDMSARRFYSLCVSMSDDHISPSGTEAHSALASEHLPVCLLATPHTVLLSQSLQAMLISQSSSIEFIHLPSEYIGQNDCA